MIEPSLRSYLLNSSPADPSAEAIVARIEDRIYREVLPQNAVLPALTYTRVSSTHDELLDGGSNISFGYFQISCWALDPDAATELAALVRTRMQGLGGLNFEKAGIEDERSDYEPETQLYRQDVDCRIAYAESVP